MSQTETKSVTYDQATLSNAEIVAPSIDKTSADLAARALREGMNKAETRDAILEVTGGSQVIEENQAGLVLNAAAALLKLKREAKKNAVQSQTNDAKPKLSINDVTCEMINEFNEKHIWD